jgi:hypothetical protein
MFWSIAGSLCVLLVITLGVLVGVWLVRILAIAAAREVKLEREGTIVKAWVVFANDNLYKKNPRGAWWNALFVCTLQKIPNLDETLEKWAKGIREFEAEDESIHEESAIAAVLRTEIGYPDPIRIPERIAGKHEGYVISFAVHCSLLPQGRLTKPYVYCKFYKGEQRDDGHARMVAYPDEEGEEL